MMNFFVKILKNIYIPGNVFTVINRCFKGLKKHCESVIICLNEHFIRSGWYEKKSRTVQHRFGYWY